MAGWRDDPATTPEQRTAIGRLIRVCLENKVVVAMLLIGFVGWGLAVAPFNWDVGVPRDPVPTDAIPDIGENQQIVFTRWMGRSPQDVEDQVTYPLTVALLGVPGVKTVRSFSMFGFSSIYVVFDEDVEFYWSRSRLLEKLNSLPGGTLPPGVAPALGPDATALGQIYWYTLEGRGPEGEPTGGWDLEELRGIQDWTVRYALLGAQGVAEVGSVGGFVREYQIDVDPDAMRAHGVTLHDIYRAVRGSNIDVGARTIELNKVEYFVRGVGFVKTIADLEKSVVKVSPGDVPIRVKDVATVALGPALRRGLLDKEGAESVGGVVVARFGANPLKAIGNVKQKIKEVSSGLPARALLKPSVARETVERYAATHGFSAYNAEDEVNHPAWVGHLRGIKRQDWPRWVTTSQVTIVPFYDRTGLIHETLGTLESALSEEILITLIVILVMLMHLRSSLLVGAMLPLTVLLCFVAMRVARVDANIVALSGIAIAIGTIVDMGIVLCENIVSRLAEADEGDSPIDVVHRAASEVAGAVSTAVATTIIGFLPVFYMSGAEGKLFRPLAFTKTFALLASIVLAVCVLPPAAHVLFCSKLSRRARLAAGALLGFALIGLVTIGFILGSTALLLVALMATGLAAARLLSKQLPAAWAEWVDRSGTLTAVALTVATIGVFLARHWEPLGPTPGEWGNIAFLAVLVGGLLGGFALFQRKYPAILGWCLSHKAIFLSLIALQLLLGAVIWFGANGVFGAVVPDGVRQSRPWQSIERTFPGLGREFMPSLDEGSYLYMPTTMVHASIGQASALMAQQNQAFRMIPEIDSVVGKVGRAETPLDPAPISMFETVINYKSEYVTDSDGNRLRFRYDATSGAYARDDRGALIPDPAGRPFRQWRDHIKSPDDIWREIQNAGRIPGTTSAPKLQPIAARIVMLQSGMRAPMGVKLKGPSLEAIERAALRIEALLASSPGVDPKSVVADRIVGKPYLEIVPDRDALARHGVSMRAFQDVVEVAVGGRRVTQSVEGRERYPIRVRYPRELRDSSESIKRVLVPARGGAQIPLERLAEIRFVRGPQVIKSEDTFLTGYVLFDMQKGWSEVDVVEKAQEHLAQARKRGELVLPAGVSYSFAGSYENQLRAQRTLSIVVPVALFAILFILYLQFRRFSTALLIFSGIAVAFSGGFLMIWLYGQSWFLNVTILGVDLRALFAVRPLALSVAVWVGFLALFGIATDDGVVIGTYLEQAFRKNKPETVADVRAATIEAGTRRCRPCLMTTATTVLALIPVLTSTGRGADIMVPMAIPSFGGMMIAIVTMLVVPTLYCLLRERELARAAPEPPDHP